MAKLVLHNTLESLSAIGTSVVGPNGVATNGNLYSFLPAKFGNGAARTGTSNPQPSIRFQQANWFSWNEFTIELHVRPNYSSGVTIPDSNASIVVGWIRDGSSRQIHWNLNENGANAGKGAVYLNDGSGSIRYEVPVSKFPFTSGILMHVALTYKNGVVTLYKDNVKMYEFTASNQPHLTAGATKISDILFFSHDVFGWRSAEATSNNLKIYDFAKTDFSDSEYQYYPPSGFGQQFLHKNRTIGVNEGTTYLLGTEVEVDMPKPTHHWKFNEKSGDKVFDYGTRPVHGVNNGASPQSSFYKFSSATITMVDSPDWDFRADDFTVTWWRRRTDTTTVSRGIISRNSTTQFQGFLFGFDTGGFDAIYMDSGTSTWDIANSRSFGPWVVGQWDHFAVTRNGANFRMYKNGILVNQFQHSLALKAEATPLTIGVYNSTAYIAADIKNIRIYNDLGLEPQQIQAVYDQELGELPQDVVPQATHQYDLTSLTILDQGKGLPILPTHVYALDENQQTAKVIDSGTIPLTAGIIGTPLHSQPGRDGKTCFSFNGTNAAVKLTTATAPYNLTEFSISFWVYNQDTDGVNYSAILGHQGGTFAGAVFQSVALGSTSYSFAFGNGTTWVGGMSCVLPLNEWHHVTIVKSNGFIGVYRDGVLVSSSTSLSGITTPVVNLANFYLGEGYADGAASRYWQGKLQDVRIYDVALAGNEVVDVMNNVTPRRSINGTVVNAPSIVNDAQMGDVLYFNGSNRLTLGTTKFPFKANKRFAISVWSKYVGSAGMIFSTVNSSAAYQGLEIRSSGTYVYFSLFNTNTGFGSYCWIRQTVDNQWHHYLFTYDGEGGKDGMKGYVDGVENYYMSNLAGGHILPTHEIFASSLVPTVGMRDDGAYTFNGYIKDLRIWFDE